VNKNEQENENDRPLAEEKQYQN